MISSLIVLFFAFCSLTFGQVPETTHSISALGWRLVENSGRENTVTSPLSIWLALAMTQSGAKGETASEMAKFLGIGNDRTQISNEASWIKKQLDDALTEKIKLSLANRIFPQKGKTFLKDFLDNLETYYQSEPEPLDFQKDTENSRKAINAWVSENTEGKIPELLKSGAIDSLTRMVLTNAIYFKAPWAEPFQEGSTSDSTFFVAPKEPIQTPFMNRKGEYLMGRIGKGNASAQICEIPYSGNKLSLLLIIPEKMEGADSVLKYLLKQFSNKSFIETAKMRSEEIELSLPKWSFRKPIELAAFLNGHGMRAAFNQNLADFSGMDGEKTLYISKVVHEGFVEVTEQGTEASGATGVVMTLRGLPPASKPVRKIKADRPFLWAVVERKSGLMLFSGRVQNPK